MPLKKDKIRQYFRIVTSNVSYWYKNHSTPNPLGVVPDPSITKVVIGDKFSEEGVRITDENIMKGESQMALEMKNLKLRNEKRCDFHKTYPGSCSRCEL